MSHKNKPSRTKVRVTTAKSNTFLIHFGAWTLQFFDESESKEVQSSFIDDKIRHCSLILHKKYNEKK